jgi:hypothetical protein
MKNMGDKEMVQAFDFLIQSLIIRGLKPHLQRLDNEASLALKNYLTKQGINYKLAPPHIHRRNSTERAIQTFMNQFIAGLCSVDPTFPLKLWDKLLPQATITLNLLRKSRINPRMLAYAQLNGHFYFNRTPLAPPGNRIIAHENPYHRASWDPRGVEGYYLGPHLGPLSLLTSPYHKKRKELELLTKLSFPPPNWQCQARRQKALPALQH